LKISLLKNKNKITAIDNTQFIEWLWQIHSIDQDHIYMYRLFSNWLVELGLSRINHQERHMKSTSPQLSI